MKLAWGVKQGKHYTISKGHDVKINPVCMMHAYARYGLRGGTEECESYLALHNDKAPFLFPVTVSWRKA